MNTPRLITSLALLSCILAGCSDSSNSTPAEEVSTEPQADTSYLDELAAKQGIDVNEDTAETESFDEPVELANSSQSDPTETEAEDEDREWEAERESKSLLGRSRDKGLDLRDRLQGSTTAGEGLAYTMSEEEYAASSGLRWEMPEDWRMAIPPRGRFGEMYIQNPLGNASVAFSKETDSVRNIIRSMQGQMIDPMGGRAKAQTSKKTIQGYEVEIVELEGTFLDPGSKGGTREQIFYAMHAVIFDLGDSRILIKMWGPQDTVNLSTNLFDKMIDQTSKQ